MQNIITVWLAILSFFVMPRLAFAQHQSITEVDFVGTWIVTGQHTECTAGQQIHTDKFKVIYPCSLAGEIIFKANGTFACTGRITPVIDSCVEMTGQKWSLSYDSTFGSGYLYIEFNKKDKADFYGTDTWKILAKDRPNAAGWQTQTINYKLSLKKK